MVSLILTSNQLSSQILNHKLKASGFNLQKGTTAAPVIFRGLPESLSPQVFMNGLSGLTSPVIEMSDDSINLQLYPQETDTSFFYIRNKGDAPLEYLLTYGVKWQDEWILAHSNDILTKGINKSLMLNSLNPEKKSLTAKPDNKLIDKRNPKAQSDNPWNISFQFPAQHNDFSAETDGNYLYTSSWDQNQFYKYDFYGNLIEAFTIEGTYQLFDMTYDGVYFYGIKVFDQSQMLQMDFENKVLVGIINSTEFMNSIAYDDSFDSFWANTYDGEFALIDKTGTVISTFESSQEFTFTGLALQEENTGRNSLFGLKNGLLIYEILIPEGIVNDVHDLAADLGITNPNIQPGGLFSGFNFSSGDYLIGGIARNECIWGATGFYCQCEHDCALTLVSPTSAVYLTEEEEITIKIKNCGTQSIQNIPVSVFFQSDSLTTEIIYGTLLPGCTIEHTFSVTVDMSTPGCTYSFVICNTIENDQCQQNDTAYFTISHLLPSYCYATTSQEDEYIANVVCGDIDNSSEWQRYVADYSDLSTLIPRGMQQEITVINGNAYTSDYVTVWVDWNNDVEFDLDFEVFPLENVNGTGEIFKGMITPPNDALPGLHRMRIRMTYSNIPYPCCGSQWGEIEDYSIVVPEFDPDWLDILSATSGTVEPGDSALVQLGFHAAFAQTGLNQTQMLIINNSPVSPLPLPIILTLIDTIPPPVNLYAEVSTVNDVLLTWEAPQNKGLLYYNIYKFEQNIGSTNNLFFADENVTSGFYNYYVTAVYHGGESTAEGPALVIIDNYPVLNVYPYSIEFVIAPPLDTLTQYLLISNPGSAGLTAYFNVLYSQVPDNWLELDQSAMYVIQGHTLDLQIFCMANELPGPGTYTASIQIESNDPDYPLVEIPVTLDVLVGLNNNVDSDSEILTILPNPADGKISILGNLKLKNIKISTIENRPVLEIKTLQGSTVDISGLNPGIYLMQIETDLGLIVRKLLVK